MAYRNYSTAVSHIVDTNGQGDFTTIGAALTAASSGQTIFIRPGTYTENPTLKAGVNLAAYGCDQDGNHVIISGKCTFTAAGTVTITGIRLQTNSDFSLAVTGSVASIVILNNCHLNCTNNTGISFTTSSASASISVINCNGNLTTTGIGIFSQSSPGVLSFSNSTFSNTGASSTANTISAGLVGVNYSFFSNPLTSSSTASVTGIYANFDTSGSNVISLTIGGSGGNLFSKSRFSSGTASSVSISSTCSLEDCNISSTNTNAIVGAGTINYSTLTFEGSSQSISTTTQSGGTIKGGVFQAPSAGFLGEVISSSVSAVATTSTVAKSITNISLTPGIWDVGCIAAAVPTGGTAVILNFKVGIGSTNNTLTGTLGIDFGQIDVSSDTISVCVPPNRVTLTATTIYYLTVITGYTSTTCPVNGRISATRVG